MKTYKYFYLLLITAVFQLGFISTSEIKRSAPVAVNRWVDLSKPDLQKKIVTFKDPLAKASAFYFLNQYEECAIQAKLVSAKSIIYDQALNLLLQCASKELEQKGNGTKAVAYLNILLKNKNQFSAANQDLLSGFQINTLLALAKKAQWKQVQAELNKIFDDEFKFNKTQRALAYATLGDLMIYERKWIDSLKYFARSKELDEKADIDTKIKNILSLIPKNFRSQFESSLNNNLNLSTVASNSNGDVMPSTEELDLLNQANNYLAKNDPISATEAMVSLLKKYPISSRSRWAQDKIFELVGVEVEKSRGSDGSSVAKNKIVKLMGEVDPERMSGWAYSLFNSQSYSDAAFLFEKSFELTDGTSTGAKNLYMAARSYQLSQQYTQAKTFYKLLSTKYSTTTEFVDGAIQWAFVNYNEKDYSEAITHFEMARSRKMTNQQDLISLFWLYQAYKTKGEEALKVKAANELIQKFPLTYYGLIAYFDLNKKLPQFEKAKSKSLKLELSRAENKALTRAKALMKVGLLDEATEELSKIQSRPLSQDENLFLAENYSKNLNYPKVFSVMSDIFDKDQNLRDDALVKTLFPKEFWSHVNDDKKRSQLDPYLLLAVMRQESAFRHQAVSRSGALGLLQMIPPTADEVRQELGVKIEIPNDMYDPGVNVKFCAYYLAKLIKKFNGSIPLALAAYNAGPTRISQFIKAQKDLVKDTWVDELPISETSFYVKSILKNYIMYKALYAGQTSLGTPPWSM